jgi:tetratricopeptide (TPR) repeat protein
MLTIFRSACLPAALCSLLTVSGAWAADPNGREGAAAGHAHEHAYDGDLGDVKLNVSCLAAARTEVMRGLALLHHMMYEAAANAFAASTRAQPDCAIGHWGQAMSSIHPLWSDPPSPAAFQEGRALLAEANRSGTKTPLESAYIAAANAYYSVPKTPDEKPNLLAFARGWASVHEQFPDDPEAALFHALAQLATAEPSDKTYARQQRAGELIEKVFAQHPNHPGAHHYIIHAYDYPRLAERALSVARAYGKIAPEVPHALHMPSHIFTRLGYWEESISWNERSAAAAFKHPVNGAVSLHYAHALDYLVYAHLQRGEDRRAAALSEQLARLRQPFQSEIASAYALAAIPARMALERQKWADAMALTVAPGRYEWDSVPAMEAITQFARALGAARSGNGKIARAAIERLGALRDQVAASNAYWAKQVEIQRLAAQAWLEFSADRSIALATMRQAAELERSTEKHPVTPGSVLPATELLGDMLLELGQYEAAQKEYEATLATSPNRLNSLYGAGRAAQLRGDQRAAESFYGALLTMTSGADTVSPRLATARAFRKGE